MTILFGHPTGNPNSHNAALAHFEAGRLEAFCLPWMPTPAELALLRAIPGLAPYVSRLERRYCPALASAPRVEGRLGEWVRMLRRIAFDGRFDSEAISYEANDWLMRTMRRECRRPSVTAVHAYEDCSLEQFAEAKRIGKACIYELPAGHYPAWERREKGLREQFGSWLAPGGVPSARYVRPDQKMREMQLADLILVPCSFARSSVELHADRSVAVTPYGVDADFWQPGTNPRPDGPLRFVYAGSISLRKGIPVLFEAWKRAALEDATLELVGKWQIPDNKRSAVPAGVSMSGPMSPVELRERFRESDVFVFPSFFEGFGLVILEAMACGLPVIGSDASAAPDVLAVEYGKVFPAGDVDALAGLLRWFVDHRGDIPAMGRAARAGASRRGWSNYRALLSSAVAAIG